MQTRGKSGTNSHQFLVLVLEIAEQKDNSIWAAQA